MSCLVPVPVRRGTPRLCRLQARVLVRVIQVYSMCSRLCWLGVRRALEVVPPLSPEGRFRTMVHLVVAEPERLPALSEHLPQASASRIWQVHLVVAAAVLRPHSTHLTALHASGVATP